MQSLLHLRTLTEQELGEALFQHCIVTGEFRLRSGATSNEYFDKYRFESDPTLLRETAIALSALVPGEVETIAGLELGGIPIATMLSQLLELPTVFVRKEAKGYGTNRLAEGSDIARRNLVVVEDVVTSGGQLLKSSLQLRALGANILKVIAVIDRGAGGAEALAAEGFQFAALYRYSELKAQGADLQ